MGPTMFHHSDASTSEGSGSATFNRPLHPAGSARAFPDLKAGGLSFCPTSQPLPNQISLNAG